MNKIKISVNGEIKEFCSTVTVKDIVESLDMKSPMFAVELNLNIIQKDEYEKIQLQDNDCLEVVTFFGGG